MSSFPKSSYLGSPADLSNQQLFNSLLGRDYSLTGIPAVGATPLEIQTRFGLAAAEAWTVAAALELGRRSLAKMDGYGRHLHGGEAVYQYLAPKMGAFRVESFFALYLDAKGRLLLEKEISRGTLTTSLVHPREVFAPALLYRAAAVVVAHNHPSGDPSPSAEDRTTTRRLQRAGRLLGVDLLDHVILGRGKYLSFLEEGWL